MFRFSQALNFHRPFRKYRGARVKLGIRCIVVLLVSKFDPYLSHNAPHSTVCACALVFAIRSIELCTKQTRNRVCVTHPLAVYKTARCSLILPTKTLVRTRYVQFTYFMERVYWGDFSVLKRTVLLLKYYLGRR